MLGNIPNTRTGFSGRQGESCIRYLFQISLETIFQAKPYLIQRYNTAMKKINVYSEARREFGSWKEARDDFRAFVAWSKKKWLESEADGEPLQSENDEEDDQ